MAEVDLIIEAISKGFDKAAADIKKVGNESEGAGKQTEGAAKKFGGFGSTITGLVGAGALLGLASQLVRFGKQAIMAASDAQEMQSKFNIVFGDVGGKVTQQLNDFAKATGASRFELMGMAATLGDTFKPMGYTADEAGKLSVQMVKLATDLSSFNNIPVGEALQRIQGGLIGNHENLLKFGVLINEASLKEELMRMGADNLTGAQLNQAKVQARLNILMAGTTDAQGDAVRTADGFANKSRALQSALSELSITLGNALLPSATETVTMFTRLIDVMNMAAGVAGQYDQAIIATVDGNVKSAESTGDVVAESLKLVEAVNIINGQRMVGGLFGNEKEAALDGIKQLMSASVDFAETSKDVTDQNNDVVASLEKVYGGAVELRGSMIYLNGVAIENVDALRSMAQASQRAAVFTTAFNAAQKVGAGVLALVAENTAEATSKNEQSRDAYDELANSMSSAEMKAMMYNNQLADGIRLAGEERASAAAAIQSSRERAAGQAALTEEIRKTSLAMVEAAAEARTGYFNAAVEASDQTGLFTVAIDDLGSHLISVGGRTKQQADDLGALQEQYNTAAGVVHDYQVGIKGLGMSEDERNAKIQEQLDAMGALQGAMQPLIDITGKLTEVNSTTVISQDYVKQAMYDAAVAAGVSADALAVMRVNLGLSTEEQAIAELATANFGSGLDILAGQLKTGKISQAEYEEKVRLLTLSLVPSAQAQYDAAEAADANKAAQAPLTDGLNNSAMAAENLANKLNALPSEKTINVNTNYTESGTPTNAGPAGPPTSAPGAPPTRFAAGGVVRGGIAGVDSVPALLMPGEEVLTKGDPRNIMNGGNTSTTIINNFPLNLGATAKEIANMVSHIIAGDLRKRAASGGQKSR